MQDPTSPSSTPSAGKRQRHGASASAADRKSYAAWDQLAKDEVAEVEAEAVAERAAADAQLGLQDGRHASSHAEQDDKRKRAALVEAKKGWDHVKDTKQAAQVAIEGEVDCPHRVLDWAEDLQEKRVSPPLPIGETVIWMTPPLPIPIEKPA